MFSSVFFSSLAVRPPGLPVFSSWVCPWRAAGLQLCQASGCGGRTVSTQLGAAQGPGQHVLDDSGVGGRELLGLLLQCHVGKALTPGFRGPDSLL